MTLLVAGNIAVDRFYAVDRLPAEGESVLADEGAVEPGGKGFNQAVTAARCGAHVRFMTVLGDDADAAMLAEALAREGLDGPLALRRAGPSDRSLVLVDREGRNMVITTVRAVAALPRDALLAAAGALGPGDGLLMQGNADPVLTAEALSLARARGARAMLNPSPMRSGLGAAAAAADVLIVNEGESAAAPVEAALRVVTLGPRGARLDAGGRSVMAPAPPAAARDTTGAGDVLAGVFAARLLAGDAPVDALARAVRAATAKVSRAGTGGALPSRAQLAALCA